MDNTSLPQDYMDEHFKQLLGVLINEKGKTSNKDFAREIAITITEVEKAYAYFQTYVLPNYVKESES